MILLRGSMYGVDRDQKVTLYNVAQGRGTTLSKISWVMCCIEDSGKALVR
jgi:hypothetical protein